MRVSRMFSFHFAEFAMSLIGAVALYRVTGSQLQLASTYADARRDSDDAAQLAVGWALLLIIACLVGVAGYRISRTDGTSARGWRGGAFTSLSALLLWSIALYSGSRDPVEGETFFIKLLAIAITTLISIVPSVLARAPKAS